MSTTGSALVSSQGYLADFQSIVRNCPYMTGEEKSVFLGDDFNQKIQDPTFLSFVFQTAQRISLLAPFDEETFGHDQIFQMPSLQDKTEALKGRIRVMQENGMGAGVVHSYRGLMMTIPKELTELPGVRNLRLDGNRIRVLLQNIGVFSGLTVLSVDRNLIKEVPESIASLKKLQKLSLNGNQIQTLPDSMKAMSSLIEVRMANNGLNSIPPVLIKMPSLAILDLSSNQIGSLPADIGAMRQLVSLNMSDNQLQTVPDEIGSLSRLTYLELSKNKLEMLPEGLKLCKELKVLDISNNPMRPPLMDLSALSSLEKLLAFGMTGLFNPKERVDFAKLSQLRIIGVSFVPGNDLGREWIGGAKIIYRAKDDE